MTEIMKQDENQKLKRRTKFKYLSYEELRDLCRKKGVRTTREYRELASEILEEIQQSGDFTRPRMPSRPEKFYGDEWTGYSELTGEVTVRRVDHVYDWEEAKVIVAEFGFAGIESYREGYKVDPRLPSHPEIIYSEQWVDWYDFLSIPRPSDDAYSWEQAKEAAKKLNCKSGAAYRREYKADSLLVFRPERAYKEHWKGWSDFLGLLPKYTYSEAQAAVRLLEISSSGTYALRYKEDSRLVSRPDVVFSDCWVGWDEFLGLDKKGG